MNTKHFVRFTIIVAVLFSASLLYAQPVLPLGLQPDSEILDAGLIRGWFGNAGRNFSNPTNFSAGLEFPKGSTNIACYSQLTWFVTQYGGSTNALRSSSSLSSPAANDFQPGRLLRKDVVDSSFDARILKIKTGDNELNNADYKRWLDLCNQMPPLAPYRVRRNYLGQDSVIFGNVAGVPATYKVPWLDSKGRRVPELLGDQTLWMVYNDLKGATYFSKRNNMEMEQTIFAFGNIKRADQIVFLRYKITNKSDSLWKNSYFGVYADVDIGVARYDFVGCDTTIGVGYTYDYDAVDPAYSTNPPATGFMFLKGTRVAGADGSYIRKADGSDSTLKIRAFRDFYNTQPPPSQPQSVVELYNCLQGKTIYGTQLFGVYPGSTFMFPGDPLQPYNPITNLIDLLVNCPVCTSLPDDKRMMISIGPFDMQPNESQEIYVAACVGQSRPTSDNTGNLRATGEVRYIATVAQNLFDLGFGSPEGTSDTEFLPPVPSRYSLSQNYPNPFNPVTTIKYELPEDVIVSLQVYDMSGRKVAVLVDKQAQQAGIYEAKFNAAKLASGVYLYRLKAGPYFKTRKLVVVK